MLDLTATLIQNIVMLEFGIVPRLMLIVFFSAAEFNVEQKIKLQFQVGVNLINPELIQT